MSGPRIDPSRQWEKDVWYKSGFGARADEHEMEVVTCFLQ
jgi:hypothetical protein